MLFDNFEDSKFPNGFDEHAFEVMRACGYNAAKRALGAECPKTKEQETELNPANSQTTE